MKQKRKEESLDGVKIDRPVPQNTRISKKQKNAGCVLTAGGVYSDRLREEACISSPPSVSGDSLRNKRISRKVSTKKLKNPFKSLKRASGTTGDIAELYSSLKPSLLLEKQSNIYIGGKCYDTKNIFSTDTFLCHTLEQCASSSASTARLLFVGLKNNLEPINLFGSPKRETTSAIAVITHELEVIDILKFDRGIATQIHVQEEIGQYCLTVLFIDGTLHQFKYNTTAENKRCSMEIANNSPAVTSQIILADSSKIIKFCVLKNIVAYTDGFTVTTIVDGDRRTTQPFKTLIVDLALFTKDGTEHIFLLDRNGGHFYCEASLTNYASVGSFPGFYKLVFIPEYNLLLSTDGMTYKNHSDISIVPKALKKECRFYLPTFDGTVTAYRLLNKDRMSLRMFRLVSSDKGLVFCISEEGLKNIESSRINIINIYMFYSYLLLVTEHGNLLKIYLE